MQSSRVLFSLRTRCMQCCIRTYRRLPSSSNSITNFRVKPRSVFRGILDNPEPNVARSVIGLEEQTAKRLQQQAATEADESTSQTQSNEEEKPPEKEPSRAEAESDSDVDAASSADADGTKESPLYPFIKEGRTAEAVDFFEKLVLTEGASKQSMASYVMYVEACVSCGYALRAYRMFERMVEAGIQPTRRIYDRLFRCIALALIQHRLYSMKFRQQRFAANNLLELKDATIREAEENSYNVMRSSKHALDRQYVAEILSGLEKTARNELAGRAQSRGSVAEMLSSLNRVYEHMVSDGQSKLSAAPMNEAISAFARADSPEMCVKIFHRMLLDGIRPTGNTLRGLLQMCEQNERTGYRDAIATFNQFRWHYPDAKLGTQVFFSLAKCALYCELGQPNEIRDGQAIFWESELADKLFQELERSSKKTREKPTISRHFVFSKGAILVDPEKVADDDPDASTRRPKKRASSNWRPLDNSDWAFDSDICLIGQTRFSSIHINRFDVAQLNLSPHRRFKLLGGLRGFLRCLDHAKARPTASLFAQLLLVLPTAAEYESALLSSMRARNVVPNVKFLTALLQRARRRNDELATRRTLRLFTKFGIAMNDYAWCVAAINRFRLKDAQTLLADMERSGVKPRMHTLTPLLQASQFDFEYKLFLVDYAWRNRIAPDGFSIHIIEYHLLIAQKAYDEAMRRGPRNSATDDLSLIESLDRFVPPRFETVPQNEAERETLIEYFRSLRVQRQFAKFKLKYQAWRVACSTE